MNSEIERYVTKLLKLTTLLVVVFIIYFAVIYLFPVLFKVSITLVTGLVPFILAIIITVLIDPIVDWFVRKKNIKRGYAVAFTLIFMLALIVTILVFIVSRLTVELLDIYRNLPSVTQHIMNSGLDLLGNIRNFITNNPLPIEAQNALQNSLQEAINWLTRLISLTTNFFISILTGLPAFVTIILVSGVATFFISRDKVKITNFIYSLLPRKYIKPTSQVIGDISSAVVGFFRAQTILISITGIQTIIGLYFLGVDYAVTIGIMVGILDLLPILGPGTIFIPWVIFELILGNINFGIALLILYAILIGIRQLIEPKILSQNIGLHPLATLMALYLGLSFIGIWGIVLGPFIVILIKSIIKSLKSDE